VFNRPRHGRGLIGETSELRQPLPPSYQGVLTLGGSPARMHGKRHPTLAGERGCGAAGCQRGCSGRSSVGIEHRIGAGIGVLHDVQTRQQHRGGIPGRVVASIGACASTPWPTPSCRDAKPCGDSQSDGASIDALRRRTSAVCSTVCRVGRRGTRPLAGMPAAQPPRPQGSEISELPRRGCASDSAATSTRQLSGAGAAGRLGSQAGHGHAGLFSHAGLVKTWGGGNKKKPPPQKIE